MKVVLRATVLSCIVVLYCVSVFCKSCYFMMYHILIILLLHQGDFIIDLCKLLYYW